jgi:tetratricopeptide (TPR) repeat protein
MSTSRPAEFAVPVAPRRHAPWLALACTAAAAAAGVATGEPSKYKAQGKAYSVQIDADPPTAGVMRDGLFLGQVGSAFDAEPGLQRLVVQAPGYVPRLVNVVVGDASKPPRRTVKLLKAPAGSDVELDFEAAKNFPIKAPAKLLPSLCARYQAQPLKLIPSLLLPCTRFTALDDLDKIAPARMFAAWRHDSAAADFLGAKLSDRLYDAASDEFYWQAEELYGLAPDDPGAANLLAFSSIQRQDCGRVMQIALEQSAAHVVDTGMILLRGICIELTGETSRAVKYYQGLAGGTKTPPELYYHVARGVLVADQEFAERALTHCANAYPHYYPCFEALAHVQAIRGRPGDGENTMHAYLAKAALVTRKLLAASPPNPAAVAAQYALRPKVFELAAAHALTSKDARVAERILGTIDGTLVADPRSVAMLQPLVERAKDPRLMAMTYRGLVAGNPNSATLWIKFADALRQVSKCDESLNAAAHATSLTESSERRAAIVISNVDCMIKTGRLEQAERQLGAVVQAFPGNWKTHYNLGIVEDRLGKHQQALDNFEVTLSSNPPEDVRARVEDLMAYRRAAQAKDAAGSSSVGH